jgi:hypothetical protein
MGQYTTGGRNQSLLSSPVLEYSVALAAATVTTGGAVVSILNPFGFDVFILRAILDVTTVSTGVATIDLGVAANGTTSNDTLIDGKDLNAATGVFDNITDKGTNGKPTKKWTSTQYVTGTASATMAGLVGNLTLVCVRA